MNSFTKENRPAAACITERTFDTPEGMNNNTVRFVTTAPHSHSAITTCIVLRTVLRTPIRNGRVVEIVNQYQRCPS